jgi:OFA family oxalate/formate antiporter-like MFS transporter
MKLKRTAPLLAGALVYLFIGLIYAWSIFAPSLEAEFGWNRTQTSVAFTVSMSCFCLGSVLSGFIQKKRSPKTVFILSALLFAIGFFGASRISSLLGLYVSYGVFCGLGVGISYNADISTVTRWYPDKIGMVSGILLMCFGLGSMILGSLASSLISSIGWRKTFALFAIVFPALILLCSFWIRPPEADTVLPEAKKSVAGTGNEAGLELSPLQMLRRKSFWFFFIWASVLSAAGLAIIGHVGTCIKDIGATVALATLASGIVSVFNGLGRIVVGLIFDKFGRRVSMIYGNLMMLAAFVIFIISYGAGSIPLFFIAAIILGLGYGSVPPMSSAFVSLFYGKKNYPLNFSIMNLNIIPASILGPLMGGAIQTATGSYTGLFIIMLALSSLVFVLQFFIKKP